MANKQDIITAIKNLDLFLKIPQLQGAVPRFNKNGNPFVYVGGFNMVFQLTHNFKKWAFRVWHVPMDENEERYLKISNYLSSKKLSYFAEFIYDKKGILVNGELIDTIRMEWLEGILLKEFIEQHLNNPSVLKKLSKDLLLMFKTLRENEISHGDLQEGNILINKKGALKLVDYDSICIPELEGSQQLVTGLKGYQHPSRFKGGTCSLKADYFSELIIYLSILILAEKPEFWDKYEVRNTQYLLFTETDFENFESSTVYQDIKGISIKIDCLISILIEYLNTTNYYDLKPFNKYLEPPTIHEFSCNKKVVIKGAELILLWHVENAIKVTISAVGEVKHLGRAIVKPLDHHEYKLTAIGFNETKEAVLNVKVFPTPLIESVLVPIPEFHSTTNLKIKIPQFPDIQLGINKINSSLDLNFNENLEEINFIELNDNFGETIKKPISSNIWKSLNFTSILGKIKTTKTSPNDK
ncbi:protein kinase domain-containing protein [Maribacter dokdonensis]|uniref:protein kinase domain-containing protein n=1 Tax=Maribacter dokdonensis TaxID=320912 RepID=UPI00071991D6|nr:hypothetical protein [Maribacter dokdonensis]KSA13477.1 Serine/threonine protein kinase [Maribacter dokdonensis DSW-8]